MSVDFLDISDYDYPLPEDKIAYFPKENRDESKLLVYRSGIIADSIFHHITDYLPKESCLVFNQSKVFPARLIFCKSTGAQIEIFCLKPVSASAIHPLGRSMQWECMVGNLKKWKNEEVLHIETKKLSLKAKVLHKRAETVIIEFSWNTTNSDFYAVIEDVALLPLPPYIKREASKEDYFRYQTVYASEKGSVAAPTAGLHFTTRVFEKLHQHNFQVEKLTLHVGAGTFKPMKAQNAFAHAMHEETFSIDISTIQRLANSKMIIPVGTTSMRVLESLYWAAQQSSVTNHLHVAQWDWKDRAISIGPYQEAFGHLASEMTKQGIAKLEGSTSIFILPGYSMKVCKGIITNFHQPKSTLLLLISALIGNNWKNVYSHALEHNYRFLSYGDSSLLLP